MTKILLSTVLAFLLTSSLSAQKTAVEMNTTPGGSITEKMDNLNRELDSLVTDDFSVFFQLRKIKRAIDTGKNNMDSVALVKTTTNYNRAYSEALKKHAPNLLAEMNNVVLPHTLHDFRNICVSEIYPGATEEATTDLRDDLLQNFDQNEKRFSDYKDPYLRNYASYSLLEDNRVFLKKKNTHGSEVPMTHQLCNLRNTKIRVASVVEWGGEQTSSGWGVLNAGACKELKMNSDHKAYIMVEEWEEATQKWSPLQYELTESQNVRAVNCKDINFVVRSDASFVHNSRQARIKPDPTKSVLDDLDNPSEALFKELTDAWKLSNFLIYAKCHLYETYIPIRLNLQ